VLGISCVAKWATNGKGCIISTKHKEFEDIMRFVIGSLLAVIGSLVSLHHLGFSMSGCMAIILLFVFGGKIAAG